MYIIKVNYANYKGENVSEYYTGRYRKVKTNFWCNEKENVDLCCSEDINKAKKWNDKKTAEDHLDDWTHLNENHRNRYESGKIQLIVVNYEEEDKIFKSLLADKEERILKKVNHFEELQNKTEEYLSRSDVPEFLREYISLLESRT